MLKDTCSQVYLESAICVQRFDDSLNSAIRITYRILLRSSSLREPRYPLLRVVLNYVRYVVNTRTVEWTAAARETEAIENESSEYCQPRIVHGFGFSSKVTKG